MTEDTPLPRVMNQQRALATLQRRIKRLERELEETRSDLLKSTRQANDFAGIIELKEREIASLNKRIAEIQAQNEALREELEVDRQYRKMGSVHGTEP